VRDAVEAGLSTPDRVRLHRGPAAAVEAAASGRVEPWLADLARHWAVARMTALEEAARADAQAAMGTFLHVVCGADSAATLDRLVPGALDEAMAGADAFFAVELPAAIGWSFAPGDVPVDLPVLTVRGTESAPVGRGRGDRPVVVPRLGHPRAARREPPPGRRGARGDRATAQGVLER